MNTIAELGPPLPITGTVATILLPSRSGSMFVQTPTRQRRRRRSQLPQVLVDASK